MSIKTALKNIWNHPEKWKVLVFCLGFFLLAHTDTLRYATTTLTYILMTICLMYLAGYVVILVYAGVEKLTKS